MKNGLDAMALFLLDDLLNIRSCFNQRLLQNDFCPEREQGVGRAPIIFLDAIWQSSIHDSWPALIIRERHHDRCSRRSKMSSPHTLIVFTRFKGTNFHKEIAYS